jgi:hypothetical protein
MEKVALLCVLITTICLIAEWSSPAAKPAPKERGR